MRCVAISKIKGHRAGAAVWLSLGELEREFLRKDGPRIVIPSELRADADDFTIITGLDQMDSAVLHARGIFSFEQLARPEHAITVAAIESFYGHRGAAMASALRRHVADFRAAVNGDEGFADAIDRMTSRKAGIEAGLPRLMGLTYEELEAVDVDVVRQTYRKVMGSGPGTRKVQTMMGEMVEASGLDAEHDWTSVPPPDPDPDKKGSGKKGQDPDPDAGKKDE